jgi:hypothetical protein
MDSAADRSASPNPSAAVASQAASATAPAPARYASPPAAKPDAVATSSNKAAHRPSYSRVRRIRVVTLLPACPLVAVKPRAGGLAAQLLMAVGLRPFDAIRIAVGRGYVNLSDG